MLPPRVVWEAVCHLVGMYDATALVWSLFERLVYVIIYSQLLDIFPTPPPLLILLCSSGTPKCECSLASEATTQRTRSLVRLRQCRRDRNRRWRKIDSNQRQNQWKSTMTKAMVFAPRLSRRITRKKQRGLKRSPHLVFFYQRRAVARGMPAVQVRHRGWYPLNGIRAVFDSYVRLVVSWLHRQVIGAGRSGSVIRLVPWVTDQL